MQIDVVVSYRDAKYMMCRCRASTTVRNRTRCTEASISNPFSCLTEKASRKTLPAMMSARARHRQGVVSPI